MAVSVRASRFITVTGEFYLFILTQSDSDRKQDEGTRWGMNWPHMTRCEINDHFKNCPQLFEDNIPQSTEFFTKKNSVAYEPCDR